MIKSLITFLIISFFTAHCFEKHDKINIYVNKVSPWANPSESYRYYSMPFCRPENAAEVSETLGERLSGNRKMTSLYNTNFLENIEKRRICSKEFSKEEMEIFRKAARENYLFEFLVEDVTVGNILAYSREGELYLVSHSIFNIWYNKETERLVSAEVKVRDFESIDITDENKNYYITFYYSVNYIESEEEATINSNKGYDSYFSDEVHWITVISGLSILSMLWLLSFIIFIKVSRKDTSDTFIGNDVDKNKQQIEEKNLWRSIRNEVFGSPANRNLLSAATGSGVQLILIVVMLCFFGSSGAYYSNRGSLYTTGVVVYSFTAIISGIVSSRIYKFIGGKLWALNIVLAACLFPVPMFAVTFIINLFAWANSLTSTLPFVTILFVLFMWALVTIPLTILGGIITGRRKKDELGLDSTVNPKSAANKPILNEHKSWIIAFFGGLLTATIMYIEMYYIFTSIWGHKIYTMWGMLFVYFVICINITACSSVVLTYHQLSKLDYRWWWKSFLHGGSVGFYIFFYAIYYYMVKSGMFGFIQTLFYFGYTSMICVFAGLLFGSVSFLSSSAFVRYMYEKSKVN